MGHSVKEIIKEGRFGGDKKEVFFLVGEGGATHRNSQWHARRTHPFLLQAPASHSLSRSIPLSLSLSLALFSHSIPLSFSVSLSLFFLAILAFLAFSATCFLSLAFPIICCWHFLFSSASSVYA